MFNKRFDLDKNKTEHIDKYESVNEQKIEGSLMGKLFYEYIKAFLNIMRLVKRALNDANFIKDAMFFSAFTLVIGCILSYIVSLFLPSLKEFVAEPAIILLNIFGEQLKMNFLEIYGFSHLNTIVLTGDGEIHKITVTAYVSLLFLIIIPFISHLVGTLLMKHKIFASLNTYEYKALVPIPRALGVAITSAIMLVVFTRVIPFDVGIIETFGGPVDTNTYLYFGFTFFPVLLKTFIISLCIQYFMNYVFKEFRFHDNEFLKKHYHGLIAGVNIIIKSIILSAVMVFTTGITYIVLSGKINPSAITVFLISLPNIIIYLMLFIFGGALNTKFGNQHNTLGHFFTEGNEMMNLPTVMTLLLFAAIIIIAVYEFKKLQTENYIKHVGIAVALVSIFQIFASIIASVSVIMFGGGGIGEHYVWELDDKIEFNETGTQMLFGCGNSFIDSILISVFLIITSSIIVRIINRIQTADRIWGYIQKYKKPIAIVFILLYAIAFPMAISFMILK